MLVLAKCPQSAQGERVVSYQTTLSKALRRTWGKYGNENGRQTTIWMRGLLNVSFAFLPCHRGCNKKGHNAQSNKSRQTTGFLNNCRCVASLLNHRNVSTCRKVAQSPFCYNQFCRFPTFLGAHECTWIQTGTELQNLLIRSSSGKPNRTFTSKRGFWNQFRTPFRKFSNLTFFGLPEPLLISFAEGKKGA